MDTNITKFILNLINKNELSISNILYSKKDFKEFNMINYNFLKCEKYYIEIIKKIIIISNNLNQTFDKINILKEFLDLIKIFQKNSNFIENETNFFLLKDTIIHLYKLLKKYHNENIYKFDPNYFKDLLNCSREIFYTINRKNFYSIILFWVNFILFIYFKINVYHQSNFYIEAINLDNVLKGTNFQDKIKFYYYYGRLLVMNSNYFFAENYLKDGFLLLNSLDNKTKYKHIKTKFLIYLIPLKILKGQFLEKTILDEYNLEFFKKIYDYISTCDLINYRELINENKVNLMRKGLFFIYEYLELYFIRNLFKNIVILNNNPTNLNINIFKKSYNKKFKEKLTIEEIECIFGNLIYKGLIRGKLDKESGICVFPKENIFPDLKQVFEFN